MADKDTDDLQRRISELIIRRFAIGERLPSEKELVAELGVSRPALRECLRALEARGIIAASRGSGRYVQLPDVSDPLIHGWGILLRVRPALLLQLLEVRKALELGFLEAAIKQLQLHDLQLLRDLVERMAANAARGESFVEEDREFHRILFSRIDNILLHQLLKAFWDLFSQANELARTTPEELVHGASLHRKLFEAVLIKDMELASNYMAEQFLDVHQRLRQSL